MVVPRETAREAHEQLEDKNTVGTWTYNLEDGSALLRILLDANQTEGISDMLSDNYGREEGFRIILFAVEATLPLPEAEEEEKEAETGEQPPEEEEPQGPARVSREELYTDVTAGSELTPVYLAMVVLSTLVAGVGLILDDVATIIGAMVIAPLLAPNVSLSLAATLGDVELGWRSFKANAAGLSVSFVTAFLMGLLFTVDPGSEEMISRTMVNLKHIIIALAAGSAGVLAFTRGVPAAIVGVMVAVALLPPLVGVGLLLGAGYMQLAVGAAILTFTNLICINLAGVLTFLAQGVRPRSWWEEKKAKKASRTALIVWLVLLAIFTAIIWYWGQFDVEAMIP
ncbi:TIGR00341 family protein [Fodinibius sediminis]|uniref:TIGR00341 family protein n=2 Tax=Fodinibius sediminis TaxID=1214077 RepID=A0A521BW84_9BACT|nr:TIGR00341 family protein [Fodinibius sediminis]